MVGTILYIPCKSPHQVIRIFVLSTTTTKSKSRQINMGEATTRVLFCGPHFPASHEYTREYLHNCPFVQVDVLPFDCIPDLIGNYDICVVKSMRLNSDVIAHATRMKLIMQYGVGLEGHFRLLNLYIYNRVIDKQVQINLQTLIIFLSFNEGIDIDAATNHGIKVARIPSAKTGNAVSCAEMAIYLILSLLRNQKEMQISVKLNKLGEPLGDTLFGKTKEMQISVKLNKLGEPLGDTLFGKTVFIMGYGSIGIELAKLLRPFGVKILATKRNWTSYVPNRFSSTDAHQDAIDEKGCHEDICEFAKKSDIIVCCLRMSSETAGIVNKNFNSICLRRP
ncbi:hypothetical protein SSX86_023817 [Deinandra increscens subsp. villosa]|uniref:D-isomer specific 2-hydroxyacid dehydrogenase NAD-binding domain-containing protein n=1 Tax=Deinandra increscens subsp. villosa TaxID=3103831 RepID=A0AAP0CGX6_9ASTR